MQAAGDPQELQTASLSTGPARVIRHGVADDACRVRVAEVLARGDQPQIAIIDKDRASEASGQPVRKGLNLLDAHSLVFAMRASRVGVTGALAFAVRLLMWVVSGSKTDVPQR
jgi:hypothetical protein